MDEASDERQARAILADWQGTNKTHRQRLLPEALLGYCKEGQEARVPVSPLFDALRDWCEADDAWQQMQLARRAALLHRLRDEARQRLQLLKRTRRVQTYDDLIDRVEKSERERAEREALEWAAAEVVADDDLSKGDD